MFGLGGKIAAGMGIALVVMGGAFYWYFNSSQETIATLNQNIATLQSDKVRLEGAIEEQRESILRLEATRNNDQERILELSEEANDARRQVSKLRETFSKHDLNHLSLAKPGLIERIINRGTAAEGREFVEITTPRKEVTAPIEEAIEDENNE